jgi:predicted PurR-regulated permease PerM
VGLLTVTFIIGTLNSIGLLILGVDHAVFFAFFAGLLTIIPYIGISIGAGLTFVYLLLTKDSSLPAFGALAIMISVQVLESNLVTPRVVGKKVSINPFVAISVLLVGSALWGIPGMALSIPLTAILKLLFDSRPHTKAFGYFLGSEFTDDKTTPFKFFGMKEPKPPKPHKK